ncbi:NUDIX domain-containing protein [Clostridium perfringens]|nr:NUDIX domain-containing protein [Clostridium perfringens]
MYFNEVLGIKEVGKEEKVFYRVAIRAVILNDDKILMVKSNTGDYKFPGGGVENGETPEETLRREVTEETGYILDEVKDEMGIIIERDRRKKKGYSLFEMTSHYYFCDVTNEKVEQNLDKYEEELGFLPVWISLDDAIKENERVIEEEKTNINPWVNRETFVLSKIKEYIYKDK